MEKETGRHRNQKTSKDHINFSIIQIDLDTEKSPGYLKHLLSLKLQ